MKSPCPCGCGRKIDLSRKGAAACLARMDEALPALREVVDELLCAPETAGLPGRDFGHRTERFLQSGEDLRRNFLAHAHGSESPSLTPDLLALRTNMNDWIGTATVLTQSAWELRALH